MKHLCQAFVKNRKLRCRVACGRSGRPCIVSGHSFHTRLILCSPHRRREGLRYSVEIETGVVYRLSKRAIEICTENGLTAADFLEGV